MYLRIFGVVLIILSLVIFGTVAYRNSSKTKVPIVFSDRAMLDGLWHSYKVEYIEASGRTLDKQRDNITTSEGQSYTLLRAVWWDDKETYDKVWKWTQDNLQHRDDKLFSWLYGKTNGGRYGVLTEGGGQNSASDADTDIALSLIFANSRWGDEQYLNEAKALLNDIWNNEVMTINGKPYLLANNIEKSFPKSTALINPSYLSPYAYKIFAQYDTAHDWRAVADSSYEVLAQAVDLPLDKSRSAGLMPDWIVIDKKTAKISASEISVNTTNYSYDAMRTPFRLSLDWQWFGDVRAKQILSKMSFLRDQWNKNKSIYAEYTHDGNSLASVEAPAIYGGSLGYFMVEDPDLAKEVYENKLKVLYNPDINGWKQQLSYYDDNWAWFGLANYTKFIINLAPQNNV